MFNVVHIPFTFCTLATAACFLINLNPSVLQTLSFFRWFGTNKDIPRSRTAIVCLLFLLATGSSAGGYVIQFTWNTIAVEVSTNGSATQIGTWLIVWWGRGRHNRLIGFRCVVCACFEFIKLIQGQKNYEKNEKRSALNDSKVIIKVRWRINLQIKWRNLVIFPLKHTVKTEQVHV